MMNVPLPTPPTDNLYKFMALLGSVLLIVSLALPSIRKEELHTEYTQKIERLNEVGRELQSAVDLNKSPEELRNTKEVNRAVGFIMGESKNLSDWLDQRREIAAEQDFVLAIAKWGGLALAVFGFTLWYVKVQRWEDSLKRLEVETKKLESGKAKAVTPTTHNEDVKKPKGAK